MNVDINICISCSITAKIKATLSEAETAFNAAKIAESTAEKDAQYKQLKLSDAQKALDSAKKASADAEAKLASATKKQAEIEKKAAEKAKKDKEKVRFSTRPHCTA